MAEYILKDVLQKKGIEDIQVSSAGTFAPEGKESTTQALMVMQEIGLEMGMHRAHRLTVSAVEEADLILTMEEAHRLFIEKSVPSASAKLFNLKQFGRFEGEGDVADPIGMGIDFYRTSRDMIAVEVARILPALIEWKERGPLSEGNEQGNDNEVS